MSQETSPQPPVKIKPNATEESAIKAVNQKIIDLERTYLSKIAEMERNHQNELRSFKNKLSGS